MIVIDASLAVKWFLEEPDSDLAGELFAKFIGQIAVPTLFGIEVAAALVREGNIDKPNARTMRRAVAKLVNFLSDGSLETVIQAPSELARAAYLALDLGHPLKDCLYLALAMELGCDLVTCDTRFAAKAKGVWAGVRVLGA